MPTGDRHGRVPPCLRPAPRRLGRAPTRGAGYLLLLFVLALLGAALGTVAPTWQQAMQREREAELAFRGLQILQALARYAAESPDGLSTRPQSLDELLVDRRHPQPRHHLRRLYADPFTGQADWVLLRAPDGGIQGLHSRSLRPLLRTQPPDGVRLAPAESPRAVPVRASQWLFELPPPAAALPRRSTR